MNQKQQVLDKVGHYFNSSYWAERWYETTNPLLGGISPEIMVEIGRYDKLMKFIDDQIEGN